MWYKFSAALLLVISSFLPQMAVAQPEYLRAEWMWPTEASTLLSGKFGETRSAHFHAGIDVKTWGREGFRVFASRDGILQRIGVSPYGYGKVVYLKHDDGSISLYAHLRDFEPGIRTLVDSIRMQTFPFRFDQNLEQYGMRFKKGDLIAFTGSTGIGPPHLHFELRTPEERPFNPLLANIKIKDTTPPRISGLALEPLSVDARINGVSRITEITTRQGSDYGTFNVSGTIGLAVNASDYADGADNVYSVYSLDLYVNNEKFFTSRVDSFGYYNTSQMFLDRVFPILRQSRRGYQRLYVRDGNTLPFYEHGSTKGRLNLPTGTHQVRVVATDYFGNRTAVTARLNVTRPERIVTTDPPRTPEMPKQVSYLTRTAMSGIEWTNNGFSIPSTKGTTKVDVCGSGTILNPGMSCISYAARADHMIPLSMMDTAMIRVGGRDLGLFSRVYPGQQRTLYNVSRQASATFESSALYDTLSVSFSADIINGVKSAALWPDHEPMKGGVKLTWLLDDQEVDQKGWGWYRRDSGRPSWAGAVWDGKRLSARVTSFGTFEILRDTIPPEVNSPRLMKDFANRNTVTVRVRDDLSGVNFESVEFYVDGRRGIIEYEPGAATLFWYHTNHAPRKGSTIEVNISDNAGNRQTFKAVLP
jgi:hypothetical protein